jgi:hypothetical protein
VERVARRNGVELPPRWEERTLVASCGGDGDGNSDGGGGTIEGSSGGSGGSGGGGGGGLGKGRGEGGAAGETARSVNGFGTVGTVVGSRLDPPSGPPCCGCCGEAMALFVPPLRFKTIMLCALYTLMAILYYALVLVNTQLVETRNTTVTPGHTNGTMGGMGATGVAGSTGLRTTGLIAGSAGVSFKGFVGGSEGGSCGGGASGMCINGSTPGAPPRAALHTTDEFVRIVITNSAELPGLLVAALMVRKGVCQCFNMCTCISGDSCMCVCWREESAGRGKERGGEGGGGMGGGSYWTTRFCWGFKDVNDGIWVVVWLIV